MPKKAQRELPGKKNNARPTTTITLAQSDKSAPVLTEMSTPRLSIALNSHLNAKNRKIHETSKKAVEVRSIQRHTFNNLILHLE